MACGRPERPSDGTAMLRGCAVPMAPLLAPLGAVQTHSWRGRVYQRLSPVCRAEKHTVRFDRQRPVRCRHVADLRHSPSSTPAPWTLTRPTAARTRNGHERILAGPSAKLWEQVHAFHDRARRGVSSPSSCARTVRAARPRPPRRRGRRRVTARTSRAVACTSRPPCAAARRRRRAARASTRAQQARLGVPGPLLGRSSGHETARSPQ